MEWGRKLITSKGIEYQIIPETPEDQKRIDRIDNLKDNANFDFIPLGGNKIYKKDGTYEWLDYMIRINDVELYDIVMDNI